MKTIVSHGPEFFRFDSYEHWHDCGASFASTHGARLTDAIYVDARGRICTRSSHYLRARDEGAFPVVVYKVDEE